MSAGARRRQSDIANLYSPDSDYFQRLTLSRVLRRRARQSNEKDTVLLEKRDGVAWVTLNRPDRLNAYNVAMRDDLFRRVQRRTCRSRRSRDGTGGRGRGLFDRRGRERVRAVAVANRGALDSLFAATCGGECARCQYRRLRQCMGLRSGGGLEMALLCDVAIAAEDARFCLPETSLGMIPGVAGTQTASRRLGLDGRWISISPADGLTPIWLYL